MGDRPNHNSLLTVILIPQSREKDLAHEALGWLDEKCDPTPYESVLAPLGMTLGKTI